MTSDPNERQSHEAAADTTTEDETATAAPTPAVSPREAHDLAGLDVFSSGDGPSAGTVATETTDEETLDATRPRAAAVLLDADAAKHLALEPDANAPARQLPIVSDQPGSEQAAPGNEADEGYDGAGEGEDEDEGDETIIAQVTPRPRTLSAAFRQSREETSARDDDDAAPRRDATLPPFPVPLPLGAQVEREQEDAGEEDEDEIEDDLDPEEEWAVADQPTIYLPPRRGSGAPGPIPDRENLPYRPQSRPGQPPTGPRPGIVRPREPLRGFAPIPAPRSGYDGPRLASPRGRPMPGSPPAGVPPAAMADPRMERFRELRGSREAHDQGDPAPEEMRPVSQIVRQWWGDLLPGLRGALRHQHEVRASGVYPISPYDAAPASRLGDAFGRLTKSARGLSDRARPALQRFHDQAEHAAQAIVGRFEPPAAVQQAPFLGPGRVAIFFKTGVTVGQAHALLMRRQARPMRLIPRKHGFLAAVAPGREAEICDSLRDHPYVRDVAYIAYDRAGQPIREREA